MDNFKNNYNLIIISIVMLASFGGYLWFIRQGVFQDFISWAQQNLILYFIILASIKMIGIVWPPIPGGLFTIGSVPVIGWQNAYLAEVIGGLAGATIAHHLGGKYGYKFLKKLFDEPVIERIKKVKIAKNKEVEAIFILRLFTGSISEAVSYGAGLLGVKYRNFIFGTIIAYIFLIPIFYLANNIFSGKNILLNGALVLTLGFLFYKLRGRYFE